MIQLDEVHIEEVRGIRKLTLPINRKTFAIQGPNGSGKSGVVDAIEFCLTGDMSRLSGRGTGGLTVKAHGPHVDARDYPDRALVRLKVFIPSLNKTATVTRKVKSPNSVSIEPADTDIVSILGDVSRHPELTLTRRQIVRFILTEAATRSKDIQTLLRLEAIDETRSRLMTAMNSAGRALREAEASRESASDALRRCLDIETLRADDLVAAANKQRAILGLEALSALSASTSLTTGLASEKDTPKGPNKDGALRDLKALEQVNATTTDTDVRALLTGIRKLENMPEMVVALQRRSFIEAGLGFADSDECPLCDTPWSLEELKSHLQQKLLGSREVEIVHRGLRAPAERVITAVQALHALVVTASQLARVFEEAAIAGVLEQWRDDLVAFKTRLQSLEGILHERERLETGWMGTPRDLDQQIVTLSKRVATLPDASEKSKANQLLIVAEERLTSLRQRKREVERCKQVANLARSVYNAYCNASTQVLEVLYESVQQEFASFYRSINRDDEGKFTAKLVSSEGKLDLTVDFHERGLFPPGAYHSEGHQDGMGLCLYLALMRQLLREHFTLAILDDVVMSVDKQHRKELCALLKDRFHGTQFIITTHDETWLRQMQSTKLVTRKTAVLFRGWTVGEGPRVNDAKDAWEEIESDLSNDRVPAAAATLRRHLEFVFGEISESLGAYTPHRLDGNFDLGDLLPNAIGRMKDHLRSGIKSAKAWKDNDAQRSVEDRMEVFTNRQTRGGDEQWVVNKAVHFNEWADFTREDFEPVVTAFRELVECFRCAKCGTWLNAMPRTSSESLKCDCATVSINLTMPS